MSHTQVNQLASAVDELITDFKITEARRRLNSVALETVPLSQRRTFSQLCRRTGQSRLALKFMHALIHEHKDKEQEDLIEYASVLRRVGLIPEALRILQRCGNRTDVLLQTAFCYVHIWDYEQAAVHLRMLLKLPCSERESRLARVNLIASLLFLGDFSEAKNWLQPLEEECRASSPHLFLNCKEFRARIQFLDGDANGALRALKDLDARTPGQVGTSKLAIEKWIHIMSLALNPTDTNAMTLNQFRQRARSEANWEALRSFDWECSKILENNELAAEVYFGSPYPALKKHIRQSSMGSSIPAVFERQDKRWAGASKKPLNLVTGENLPMKFGGQLYRTLALLLSDQYQPWTIYRVFDGLFADEAFNPFSSPKRVYRLLELLKKDIAKHEVPLELQSAGIGFRLRPVKAGAAIIIADLNFDSIEDILLNVIRTKFTAGYFSAKDLAKVAPLSQHQSYRAIKKLLDRQSIEKTTSSGKTLRYRIRSA